MFTIHLQNLQFKAYHGLYAEEKVLGNHFIVDVWVKYLPEVGHITNIGQTINYQDLFAVVTGQMAQPVELLETLTTGIANELLQKFTAITEVDVRVVKKNPPIQNFTGNVAVSYHLKRK